MNTIVQRITDAMNDPITIWEDDGSTRTVIGLEREDLDELLREVGMICIRCHDIHLT